MSTCRANGTPGTPRPGSDKTAYVRGFDKFQDEDTVCADPHDVDVWLAVFSLKVSSLLKVAPDVHLVLTFCLQIRNGLSELLGECGDIVNIRIPTDRETGNIKG